MESQSIKSSQFNAIKSFPLEDFSQWYLQLIQNGSVVIKDILSAEEVKRAEDAFWEWLENLGNGIKRDDPSTWNNQKWPGLNDMGFFVSYGGCHTATSWMIRTHPKVKEVFSKIWNTEKLITSFDTIISWRPWWNSVSQGKWTPFVQNLHLDQNPYFKNGLKCVQGMLPLKRVRQDEVGGIMMVPKSNSKQVQAEIIKRYPSVEHYSSDWLQLQNGDPLMGKGKLVECNAGDLILWDSRTVHGGKICTPTEQFKQQHKDELVRLAVTVTMVPRQWCNKETLKLREEYFQKKIGTTHWPQQASKNSMGKFVKGITNQKITYKFPQLSEQIKALI